jgi:soluble lytic murein transglycosylase-like protein
LISAAFRCDVDLTIAPHRRISATVWGSSVDAAHDPALFAGGERTAQAQVTQAHVTQAQATQERAAIEVLIVQHAKTHGLPVELVRLVIRRESNFNPRAVYRGNFGLMQIRLGIARALGYRGDAEGLLDPATNMAYGVPYLAGAYRAAHGDEVRALVLYSRGYHDVH